MELSDIIELDRVHIEGETPDLYTVKYKDRTYEITKSTETCFVSNGSSSAPSMRAELRLENRIVPETEIFQDSHVPTEFKETMMFHEIREMEYKSGCFEDAHKRAVNDEVLYALKFFDKKTQKEYIDFAQMYRKSKIGTKKYFELKKGIESSKLDTKALQSFYRSYITYGTPFMDKAKELMELSKVHPTRYTKDKIWDCLLHASSRCHLVEEIKQFRETFDSKFPKRVVLKKYDKIIKRVTEVEKGIDYRSGYLHSFGSDISRLYRLTGVKPIDKQKEIFGRFLTKHEQYGGDPEMTAEIIKR